MKRRTLVAGTVAAGALVGLAYWQRFRLETAANYLRVRLGERRTLDQALATHGPAARARLHPRFARMATPYPPAAVTLIGLKAERRLEVWVSPPASRPLMVATYPVLAASGGPGPKLREGDRQVPEGIYPITFLNPNSLFHLSLRVGYPSAEDHARAAEDGRTNLGGDIMIHGAGGSIGCLAVSNRAIEELFVLAADVGLPALQAILVPFDLRGGPIPPAPEGAPAWTADRYASLHRAMAPFTASGT